MNNDSDFVFEYEFTRSDNAEERMAEAWEIILALILEDYQNEIRELENSENEK